MTGDAIQALDRHTNGERHCYTHLKKIKTGSHIDNVKFFGLDGHVNDSDRNIDAYYEGEVSCEGDQMSRPDPTPNGFGRLMV